MLVTDLIIFVTYIQFWIKFLNDTKANRKIDIQNGNSKLKTVKSERLLQQLPTSFLGSRIASKRFMQFANSDSQNRLPDFPTTEFFQFLRRRFLNFENLISAVTIWNACVRVKFMGSLCFWQISFFFCQQLKRCLREKYYDKKQQEYFLDRHKATFEGLFRKIVMK